MFLSLSLALSKTLLIFTLASCSALHFVWLLTSSDWPHLGGNTRWLR